jgi:hypothetical protein
MGLAFVPVYIRYLGMKALRLIGLFAMLQPGCHFSKWDDADTESREGARSAQSIGDLLRSVEMLAFAVTACIALVIWLCADYLAHGWLNTKALPTLWRGCFAAPGWSPC